MFLYIYYWYSSQVRSSQDVIVLGVSHAVYDLWLVGIACSTWMFCWSSCLLLMELIICRRGLEPVEGASLTAKDWDPLLHVKSRLETHVVRLSYVMEDIVSTAYIYVTEFTLSTSLPVACSFYLLRRKYYPKIIYIAFSIMLCMSLIFTTFDHSDLVLPGYDPQIQTDKYKWICWNRGKCHQRKNQGVVERTEEGDKREVRS